MPRGGLLRELLVKKDLVDKASKAGKSQFKGQPEQKCVI